MSELTGTVVNKPGNCLPQAVGGGEAGGRVVKTEINWTTKIWINPKGRQITNRGK